MPTTCDLISAICDLMPTPRDSMNNIQVEGEPQMRGRMEPERVTHLELDKASMGTLVSTLSRIRDQLKSAN
jgi:hypothetical protein